MSTSDGPALGRRHVGVAGADDLVDRGDARRTVGQRRHRLRAADAEDLVDAGELRGGEHQRIELAVRRRHHHHETLDAGHFRRHRVHQHRGRIGGGAARHVEPGGGDRGPAIAELDTERIGEALVLRQLPAVIGVDALAGELQRGERAGLARCGGGRELAGGDAQPDGGEIDPIEFAAELDQRGVATRHHVGDDRLDGVLDVLRGLALGGEKGGKLPGKVGVARIEADRHGEPFANAQWRLRGVRVNPAMGRKVGWAKAAGTSACLARHLCRRAHANRNAARVGTADRALVHHTKIGAAFAHPTK
jgi:hypothetical protein